MNPFQSSQQREQQLTKLLHEVIELYQSYCPAWLELTKEIDLSQINSLQDLTKLPILSKDTLPEIQQQHPPFGHFRCSTGQVWHLYISPGPIYELDTQCDDFWGLEQAMLAAGVNSEDRIANTFSYHYTPAGMMFDEAARKIGCQILPAGPGNTSQLIEAIEHFKITTYVGTPDFLKIVLDKVSLDKIEADKADEHSWKINSLCKAVVTGGYLSPSIRQQCEQAGIAIYQCYATADIGLIAYECDSVAGMVCAENIWIEIINPQTMQPVAEGETGEVVVSRLTNNAPLLRFATGDLSAFIINCPTTNPTANSTANPTVNPTVNNRTHLKIKGWLGRSDESVKVKGQFIRPVQIKNLFNQFENIHDMQLQVTNKNDLDHLCLYVHPVHLVNTVNAEESIALSEQLQQKFREITGLRTTIQFVQQTFDSLINDKRVVINSSRNESK